MLYYRHAYYDIENKIFQTPSGRVLTQDTATYCFLLFEISIQESCTIWTHIPKRKP